MEYFSQWVQYATIFFLSVFKYGFGLFTAINSNLGFWPSILTNILGSAVGVWMFTYFGVFIKHKYISYYYKNRVPKKFTKWNRFLIKFKKRFGLIGIAFLSPVLLTIPVGVLLSLQLTENKKKIFFFIFSACIIWSWIFFIANYFFGLNIH